MPRHIEERFSKRNREKIFCYPIARRRATNIAYSGAIPETAQGLLIPRPDYLVIPPKIAVEAVRMHRSYAEVSKRIAK